MKTKFTPLMTGLMLVALALATGCNKAGSSSASGDDSEADEPKGTLEQRVDKHGDEVMASDTKAEARAWMKHSKHVFFKADAKQVGQFVEDFYGAGATQVLICDVEEHDGTYYGEGLLVVLPKEKGARAKLFEIGARADTAFQNDPTTDKGQKYLYYSLD
jgi:hypothetical protein